jgi:hypothetical protein
MSKKYTLYHKTHNLFLSVDGWFTLDYPNESSLLFNTKEQANEHLLEHWHPKDVDCAPLVCVAQVNTEHWTYFFV